MSSRALIKKECKNRNLTIEEIEYNRPSGANDSGPFWSLYINHNNEILSFHSESSDGDMKECIMDMFEEVDDELFYEDCEAPNERQ